MDGIWPGVGVILGALAVHWGRMEVRLRELTKEIRAQNARLYLAEKAIGERAVLCKERHEDGEE